MASNNNNPQSQLPVQQHAENMQSIQALGATLQQENSNIARQNELLNQSTQELGRSIQNLNSTHQGLRSEINQFLNEIVKLHQNHNCPFL